MTDRDAALTAAAEFNDHGPGPYMCTAKNPCFPCERVAGLILGQRREAKIEALQECKEAAKPVGLNGGFLRWDWFRAEIARLEKERDA